MIGGDAYIRERDAHAMHGGSLSAGVTASHRLERAFTMAEAAALLRISKRALQELIKRHPFYYANGTRKLFQESDIEALRSAMRAKVDNKGLGASSCLSNSYHLGPVKHRTIRSGGHTSGNMWTAAQKRLSEIRQQNS